MILYFIVYVFSLPWYFSCHKISTLAFRSMSVIYPQENYHNRVKVGQWPVFTQPMSIFYPILLGINQTSFFSIFLPNDWAVGFFFWALKDFGNTKIFPENQILFWFAKWCRKCSGLYKFSAFYPPQLYFVCIYIQFMFNFYVDSS